MNEAPGWEKDSVASEKVKRWREQINNDFVLREAVQVLNDWTYLISKSKSPGASSSPF
jgi:hypothetical protein